MKRDDEITDDWRRLETENLAKACEYLSRCETAIEDYIAECVASLCNIDVDEMLTNTAQARLAQPRWLYWYAVRYMTSETYDEIAERTRRKCGHSFTANGIGQSINKMAQMISTEPMWTKRWTIIKHIIKMRDKVNTSTDTVVMRVIAPKGMKVELKTE